MFTINNNKRPFRSFLVNIDDEHFVRQYWNEKVKTRTTATRKWRKYSNQNSCKPVFKTHIFPIPLSYPKLYEHFDAFVTEKRWSITTHGTVCILKTTRCTVRDLREIKIAFYIITRNAPVWRY